MQLIMIFETRASCKSDYRYVKSAMDYFYVERSYKLTPLFASSKSELTNQEGKIKKYKGLYAGDSAVIICADYDREDDENNAPISLHCKRCGYELVWMNRNVEEVFLGKSVPSRQKEKESTAFLRKKETYLSTIHTLDNKEPLLKHPSSNLLVVLDKYINRKHK